MQDFDWKTFEKQFQEEFSSIVSRLESNFKKLYVSRVHPDLVSGVMVSAYGSDIKLNDLANITIPSARTLLIKPYDVSVMDDMVEGLKKYKPEFSPVVSSDHIKIVLNPPTEESRRKAVKEAKEFLEQGKVSVRILRKDYIAKIRSAELSEDLEKKYSGQIDAEVKSMNSKLDFLFTSKEKELMSI